MNGPLLYEVRCWTEREGKPHGLLLARGYRVGSQTHWQFEPGAWASSSEGSDPQVYVKCSRHGVGSVAALTPHPVPGVRSKPRVVRVVCV